LRRENQPQPTATTKYLPRHAVAEALRHPNSRQRSRKVRQPQGVLLVSIALLHWQWRLSCRDLANGKILRLLVLAVPRTVPQIEELARLQNMQRASTRMRRVDLPMF
jgi:hypothetical protein